MHICNMCGREYDLDEWDACPYCDPSVSDGVQSVEGERETV